MATTTHSSGHIRKRQYQPSITSFFNQRDANITELSQLQRSASPLSPPLPADTQASLLSVGMRVRKSVPEGYKTHKTLAAPGYPFPSSAPAVTAPTRKSYGAAKTRELTPFCGLHKTGGWAAQEGFTSSAPAVIEEYDGEDEDEAPGVTMSQSTLTSTQRSFQSMSSTERFGASKKRGYDEELEDDLDAYFDGMDSLEEAPQSRPIAKLKGTKGSSRVGGPVVIADDFEDANFLSPVDGMELDSQ